MKTRTVTETYTCDRCNGPLYPSRGYNYHTASLRLEIAAHDAFGNGAGCTRIIDLCDPCTTAVLNVLDSKEAT